MTQNTETWISAEGAAVTPLHQVWTCEECGCTHRWSDEGVKEIAHRADWHARYIAEQSLADSMYEPSEHVEDAARFAMPAVECRECHTYSCDLDERMMLEQHILQMVDAYRRQAAKDEASKMLSQALREILTGAKA